MNPILAGQLSISSLMQHKAFEPLDEAARSAVERIAARNVEPYKEADVREDIVAPLLDVLGYDRDADFSIEREKEIRLAGGKRYLDYAMAPWSRNHWLIEAKSAKGRNEGAPFTADDVEQAVGYAVHPDINAALVVLCDGWKIAVFDREEDLVEPVLTIRMSDLVERIDELRALLGPWQAWLFETRRVVRHVDRVFDTEFNMGRVEEFRWLVNNRLDSKRRTVIDNMRRARIGGDDPQAEIDLLRSSEPVDLVEAHFFIPGPRPAIDAMAETLVRHCGVDAFRVLHRVFPDEVRPMNDDFCLNALNFLLHLEREGTRIHWLPGWLGGGKDVAAAVKTFLRSCLTQFATDPGRRAVLLGAAAIRRLYKAQMVVDLGTRTLGEMLHAFTRYMVPEDEWRQLLSSPGREMLLALDGLVVEALGRLLRRCCDANGRLEVALLEAELREIWRSELRILGGVSSYWSLADAQQLVEIVGTEHRDVVVDGLGHGILCVVDSHPYWKAFVLEAHAADVETLAAMGSWMALRWLGQDEGDTPERPPDSFMAERFFLGDVGTFRRLRAAYAGG